MRLKGKLTQWRADKAFGFIAPNSGGSDVFIHKTAFANKKRIPQVNDMITFSITKDRDGRYCACDATFSGESLKQSNNKQINKFSIYLAVTFLATIVSSFYLGYSPVKLMAIYFGLSTLTFVIYATDKSKAQREVWRTPESTLHLLALAGGWPGAALAQQYLRHKSSKLAFRRVFWATVMINLGLVIWLHSPTGIKYLSLLN
ncbi:DUF1294 domain-containing protein [Colwellia sp. Arc7-635]|uniref:DUF1294 domain-containing protein n=1 Tax=Colwellia sp. Arc7-635 TaxID=2497879 RepID=UPI000F8587ED|nr:cold shock and DUF1294 domain-containing protein [Colwellia sp. Arc7-635]AZQ82761.1 DUF1294 domain-containing protein [Colwellia sp. Arc7-635]